MSERLVRPGTPLAYSEELLPGDGTYDDGTQIRSAMYGVERVDPETMQVTVTSGRKTIATIDKGDVVIGRVSYIKPEALASVKILAVRGKEDRTILQQVEGTLHVSKIDARYIKDVTEEYRVGDVIRAKVIGTKGGPQLATDKPEYGVVAAYGEDGKPLVLQGRKLKDLSTGQTHVRKVASDYGSGQV